MIVQNIMSEKIKTHIIYICNSIICNNSKFKALSPADHDLARCTEIVY